MSDVVRTGFSAQPFGGWLHGKRWADPVLSFSFPDQGRFFTYQNSESIRPLSEAQQDAARAVMAEIASFTALTLREVAESAGREATLRFAREEGLRGAYAYLPDSDPSGGDGFFGSATLNPVPGSEAYLFFLHEIGHAFGLDHGHEAADFAFGPLDSQEFTLMTYTDHVGDRATERLESGPVDWAHSFMQLDIAALQFLYGANHAARGEVWSGATVYSFDPDSGEMAINGVGQGMPEGNRIFRTIWDGHGRDTYDLRAYDTDLSVSLAPGAFSTLSTDQLADLNRFRDDPAFLARGNLANARLVEGDRRALIENAFGGSGDDGIAGNARANRLSGGPGEDRLEGLGGADRLSGGRGDDHLRGGAGGDRLSGGEGRDVLRGGGGDDVIFGAGGADRLTGGPGADRFVYLRVADAPASGRGERIRDFETGRDLLDLGALGDLTLLDAAGFQAGKPGVVLLPREGGTMLRVDADGDGRGDLGVWLRGATEPGGDDLVL